MGSSTLRFTCALLVSTLTACGGTAVMPPPTPHFIEGGGLADGPIAGTLFVYVADDDSRAPVSGAAVRVGGSSDPNACTATTDSTGLASFEKKTCPLLMGKQSITASASGYAPTTWIGVNAANVTMTIRATTPPPVDTATVSGTITGWDSLPAPAAQHNMIGLVGTSASPTASDATNDIAQGTRKVHVMVGLIGSDLDIPANACIRNATVNLSDCAWQLTTRTGAQAHYAVILDQDTKGTPNDDTDDTFTVTGWAVKTGLSFDKGATATGEALTLLTDDQMQPFTASFPPALTGFAFLQAFPAIDLGDAGRIAIVSPVLDATHTMTRVPKLAGPFVGAHYDFLAQALIAKGQAQPSTLSWLHAVDPSGSQTVAAPAWTPPPTAITASNGTYSFVAVAGASVQGGELQTMDGKRAWSITIFDGTTSFTLPGVSPDPLPAGPSLFVASALMIDGFDPMNAKLDDAKTKLTHLASDQVMFTH